MTWVKKISALLLRPQPRISPQGFLSTALNISLVFLALHLAGLRQYTCLLSGTLPSESSGLLVSLFLAAVYMVLYFAFVLLAPMFLLASGIFLVFEKVLLKKFSVGFGEKSGGIRESFRESDARSSKEEL